ncbi:esterase [Streptacidiphilus jiangxiensis]|uniref:Acetyl esterase/lipase n=1 Tax=Streptacidiphilus jiangxiensis TaxID=235985 RepID=A0A1H7HRS2_STRJI|nr:esterase [Streptacidiphilus jiangxiensis]SEK52868.1 Acetyl esterase/lipase [Streptacidiphilus jiangxiensis]
MGNDHDITAAFVLASGPFTGGLLWETVSGKLREAGAEVHAATLSGASGGEAEEEDGEVDLETHIAELVQMIDAVEAPRVVLVGHDYAIHPVLGAVERRVERVARVVYLDAGIPQDGDRPLALVRDPGTHALLAQRPDAVVPVPAPGEWGRWGDTSGLTPEDLERLTALSAPLAGRTLTQPLRLVGAGADVPTSGVLCTAAGVTIAAVQGLVSAGMPQFRFLAEPEVGFFELATGHWPMLSCPDELAATLLRAAAGEGERLTPPTDLPFHRRPFVLGADEAPEVPVVRGSRVDLHLPDGEGPQPAVVFVHGGPLPREGVPSAREWPLYLGYARHAAAQGVVGAVVEHRLHTTADYATAAADVAEAVALVRADPRVDPSRIALWFFSGAGLLLADAFTAPVAPWLRCVAATYPILAPLAGWVGVDPRFRPAAALPDVAPAEGDGLPIVLTRAGLESPEIAATVTEFVAAATDCGATLTVVDVPAGRHGFDAQEPTGESRAAVREAMKAVVAHLQA